MLKTNREPNPTMVNEWLARLYDEEIKDVEDDVQNDSIWTIRKISGIGSMSITAMVLHIFWDSQTKRRIRISKQSGDSAELMSRRSCKRSSSATC